MNNQPAKIADFVAFRENDFPVHIDLEDGIAVSAPVTVLIGTDGEFRSDITIPVTYTAATIDFSITKAQLSLLPISKQKHTLYIKFADEFVFSAPIKITLDGSIPEPRSIEIKAPTIGTIRASVYSDIAALKQAESYAIQAEEAAKRAEINGSGVLSHTTTPTGTPTPGINIENVSQAGTYTNFGEIVVTSGDLELGLVQLRLINGVWTKHIQELPIGDLTLKIDDLQNKFTIGQNIFNYLTMVEVGGITAGTGALPSTTTSLRTKPIEVLPNSAMVISGHITGQVIRFEDESHALLSVINPTSSGVDIPVTFTTPANTKYLRFMVRVAGSLNAAYDKIKLEYGSAATPFTPYYETIPGFASEVAAQAKISNPGTTLDSVVNVNSVIQLNKEKKIRSIDGIEEYTHNLVKPEYIFNERYLTTAGIVESGESYRALIMPVTAGQVYKISGRGWNIELHFYSNNSATRTKVSTISATTNLFQFTVPAGATYLYASIDNVKSAWITTNSTLQVYEGAATKSFAPYGLKSFQPQTIDGVTFDPMLLSRKEEYGIPTLETEINYSANLANPANIVLDQFINTTTGFPSVGAGCRWISLPVTAGKTYRVNGRGWDIQFHWFDTNVAGRTKISTVAATADPATITAPAGANWLYFTIDQTTASWTTTDTSLIVSEGAAAVPYVPYGPESTTITKVNGIALESASSSGGSLTKTIKLKDREVISFWGNSYSEGYPALPGKDYISILSSLTDWGTVNYGQSGNDVAQILSRVRTNAAKWVAGVTPKSYTGGGYVVILELTNSVGHSLINAANGYYETYMGHIDNLCNAAKALGYTPILANEWQQVGGDFLAAALSDYANRHGLVFADVWEKARVYKGTNNAKYYANAHPGVRTNSLLWAGLLPFLKALPRPKWGIKVYRKRTSVAVSTVADLAYSGVEKRASLFREIRGSAMALKPSHQQYYDDLTTLHGLGFQFENVFEYDTLMNGGNVPMADYALIEYIVNATAASTKSLRLFVGVTDATTYLYDHINQTWDAVTNTGGWIDVPNLQDYIKYDKICALAYKSTSYTLVEPYVEWVGVEGKQNEIRQLPASLKGANLFTTPNFNGGTTGWTVTGTLTPSAATDGSMPLNITQVVTVSAGNYPAQTATITTGTNKRKAQLTIVARYNPPTFSSAAVYPDESPITEDTFDFAKIKIQIGYGTALLNYERIVGLWWQEAVIDFDLYGYVANLSVKVMHVDKDFELASMSLVVE